MLDLSSNSYYTHGLFIGHDYNSTVIKFGFNGKLNDNDLGYQDYGMRLSSVKKRGFLSVDPLKESFPWYSPYQFAGNKPTIAIDLDGLEEYVVVTQHFKDGTIKSVSIQYTQTKADAKERVDAKLREIHKGVPTGEYIAEGEKVLRIEQDFTGKDISKSHSNKLTPNELKILRENSENEEPIEEERDTWTLKYKDKQYESDENTVRNTETMIDRIAIKNYNLKSYKIINDVPSIIVSNGSNNGDIDFNSKSSFK